MINQRSVHLEEDCFIRKLLDLKTKGLISDAIFKNVRPVGSQSAMVLSLYGLPKIQKDRNDPPFRPILNMINNDYYAYLSELAKWLDNLLKLLNPKKLQFRTPSSCQLSKAIIFCQFQNGKLRHAVSFYKHSCRGYD